MGFYASLKNLPIYKYYLTRMNLNCKDFNCSVNSDVVKQWQALEHSELVYVINGFKEFTTPLQAI